MSPSTAGLNTSTTIESVDEVDLAGFDQSIRAIILPKSESAVHSLRLQLNEGVIWPITNSARLPSPCDSSCEDGIDDAIRSSGQNAAILEQSREKENFTLGASLSSDIVLEHIDSGYPDEDQCYINLVHVQLFPDPDDDALILYNSSISTFTFRSLISSRVDNKILLKQETRLGRGSWQLTFGKGLDFQIKVLSRPPTKANQSWSLISPLPMPVKHPSKVVGPVLRENEDVLPPPRAHTPQVSTPRKGLAKKIGAGQITGGVDTGLESSGSRPSSPSIRASPIQRELIGKTSRTLVYKATSKKAVVAIKMCRQPSVKGSAQNWRNELDILRCLDHVSNARISTRRMI